MHFSTLAVLLLPVSTLALPAPKLAARLESSANINERDIAPTDAKWRQPSGGGGRGPRWWGWDCKWWQFCDSNGALPGDEQPPVPGIPGPAKKERRDRKWSRKGTRLGHWFGHMTRTKNGQRGSDKRWITWDGRHDEPNKQGGWHAMEPEKVEPLDLSKVGGVHSNAKRDKLTNGRFRRPSAPQGSHHFWGGWTPPGDEDAPENPRKGPSSGAGPHPGTQSEKRDKLWRSPKHPGRQRAPPWVTNPGPPKPRRRSEMDDTAADNERRSAWRNRYRQGVWIPNAVGPTEGTPIEERTAEAVDARQREERPRLHWHSVG